MLDLSLQPARKGETRAREFIMRADKVAINLTGITDIRMSYRRWQSGTKVSAWTTISTLDTSPMLVITDAVHGIVTFTPNAGFWRVGHYELYLYVVVSGPYSLPDTALYTVEVTEGV